MLRRLIYRHKGQLVAFLTFLTLCLITYSFLRLDNDQPYTVINIAHPDIRADPIRITQSPTHIHKDLIKEIVNKEEKNILQIKADLSTTKSQRPNDLPIRLQHNNHLQPNVHLIEIINRNKHNAPEDDNENDLGIAEQLQKLERIVHVDLKGAVPNVEYFRGFFKMLKEFGATGILLEYEDVFPYTGRLSEAVNGQKLSMKDVQFIKQQANDNGLYIIPLVQTYGHLEWILKLKSFSHLRDNHEYPQVITQCLEESYDLIFDMLDQVIDQHKESKYFHVGLDEVYYKLQHPNCSQTPFQGDFTKAFLSHLTRVAEHVRKRLPHATILIWDDMLHNMDEQIMEQYKPEINKYQIEPMIWAYMENVVSWFQPYLYVKYGHIFRNVWAASAYKGASGELAAVTSIQHHYRNHLGWIQVILDKHKRNVVNFRGICLTGWTRYDHFLALCDLLPQAVPSLIMNLQTMQYGSISPERKFQIGKRLGCSNEIPWKGETSYYGQIACTFPGHEVYEAILPIDGLIKSSTESMEYVSKYMTPININYNYLHKQRAHECLQRLNQDYYALLQFKTRFEQAGRTMYTNETVNEWLAVYLIPHLDPVYNMLKTIKSQISTSNWKPRPQQIVIKSYPDYV